MDLIDQAAEHLLSARRAGRRGERVPEACRPRDIAQGLAVQARVTELLGDPVAGWKCSTPKPEKIMIAPMYASGIQRGVECVIESKGGAAPIEPEIAFVIGRDVPRGSGEEDARAAISETRLVLELIGSRYERPEEATFPEMLADGLNHQGLVVGPAVDRGFGDWMRGFPIRIEGVYTGEGRHPDGHPLEPLIWLAGYRGLRAGEIVTTGSFAGVISAPLGREIVVHFGEAGQIAVRFAEAE